MQYSLAILGVFLSAIARADDLPTPRNMCLAAATDGTVFKPVVYGAVLCAATRAADLKKATSLAFGTEDCIAAFCDSNTAVHMCRSAGKKDLGSVEWTKIQDAVETAFNSCGGVSRDETHILDYSGSGYFVRSQPFQYIGDGYSLTVRGQDCNDPYWKGSTVSGCKPMGTFSDPNS